MEFVSLVTVTLEHMLYAFSMGGWGGGERGTWKVTENKLNNYDTDSNRKNTFYMRGEIDIWNF